jgi:hypothetical protein
LIRIGIRRPARIGAGPRLNGWGVEFSKWWGDHGRSCWGEGTGIGRLPLRPLPSAGPCDQREDNPVLPPLRTQNLRHARERARTALVSGSGSGQAAASRRRIPSGLAWLPACFGSNCAARAVA